MPKPQTPKSLKDMEAEVREYQQAKGWTEDRSVPASLALLHEEASEAGRAWRDWGLEDHTAGVSPERPDGHWNAKPEGVGSELADVLIRLLDDDARYKIGLLDYLGSYPQDFFEFSEHFLENILVLHRLIAKAGEVAAIGYQDAASAMAAVMAYTFQLARHYGFDLRREYERKMAYNQTREYRHGGRRA